MAAVREKLLDRLYRSFDKNPSPGLALRVRHPDGLVWSVSERVLTISTESSDLQINIRLADHTIASLADALEARGCEVIYRNHEFMSRGADALMNGGSRQSVSNGDHLYVYDSLLWSLLDAYASDLETADHFAIIEGIKQAYMHSAEGEWLDYWGGYFGIVREPEEADDVYLNRIVVEVLRPRNNARAIEQTIYDLTGAHVTLYEPWHNIFRLSVSELSGEDRLQDGNFWTWNVFQPIFHDPVSESMRARILAIIERNRPIGCLPVHERAQPPISFARFNRNWRAWFGGLHEDAVFQVTHYPERVLSSSLVLSDGREEKQINFRIVLIGTQHYYSFGRWLRFDAPARWQKVPWTQVSWGKKALKFSFSFIT